MTNSDCMVECRRKLPNKNRQERPYGDFLHHFRSGFLPAALRLSRLVRRGLLCRREKRAVCEPWFFEPAPEYALRHCRRAAAAGAGHHEPQNHLTICYDAGDLYSGPVRDRPVCPGRQPGNLCRRAEGKDVFPQRGRRGGRHAAGVSRGASRHDGTFVPDAKVAGTDAGHRRDRPDSGGLHRRDARPAHQQRHPAE